MAGMWMELCGLWQYGVGTNGDYILPAGARVISIVAQGAGTLSIFGGPAIPVPVAGLSLRFNHTLVQAQNVPNGLKLTFAGTTGFFVEWVMP